MKKYLFALFILVLLASTASSFDGKREGFIVGFGLGFTPTGTWDSNDSVYQNDNNMGLAGNLLVGYAWDEFNMIVYEENVSMFEPNKLGNSDNDTFSMQGFQGASWYHYFDSKGNTMFTTLGLGSYGFELEDDKSFSNGIGVLIGGGYEFNTHRQISIYYSTGKTSKSNIDFTHYHINLLFTLVAF